ncbi:MAG TPA: hypothetical protein VGL56_07490 [Fimbriimonadaceae bacterium]|jgi:hypothetical protein
MAKVAKVNKFYSDKAVRDAAILRNVVASSAYEGIYVTEEELKKAVERLEKAPSKKTA